MKKPTQTKSALLASTMAMTIGLAVPALADHKSNVPDIDFATRGANYPGWLSEGACANDRPGQGCRIIMTTCGTTTGGIFTTQAILDAVQAAANEGQEIPVHLVSSTGHFINHLCTIG